MADKKGWTVAARDGDRFLLVSPGDNPMRLAKVHDLDMGMMTEEQPLQVWFKWGEWEECTAEEYAEALAAQESK